MIRKHAFKEEALGQPCPGWRWLRELTASWQPLIATGWVQAVYLQGLGCVFDFLPQKCILASKQVKHIILFLHITKSLPMCRFMLCNGLQAFGRRFVICYSVVWTRVKIIALEECDSAWFCSHLGFVKGANSHKLCCSCLSLSYFFQCLYSPEVVPFSSEILKDLAYMWKVAFYKMHDFRNQSSTEHLLLPGSKLVVIIPA